MNKKVAIFMLAALTMVQVADAQNANRRRPGGQRQRPHMHQKMEQQNPYKVYSENQPFAMAEIQAPVFPNNTVSVKDCGGVGDGVQLCTEAFAKAVDSLTTQGGGRLLVPRGVWLTGPIVLKSNIDLHLEKGAVIQFAADEKLYPVIKTSFEGLDTRRCQSPLSAFDATNVAITGEGVIDGNGQYWRPVKRSKVTDAHWNRLLAQPGSVESKKGYWVPSIGYAKGESGANMNVPSARTDAEWNAIKRFLRPVMVSIVRCKNVLLQGVIFQNSPAWNLHPLMCENVILDNVLVRNPAYAQNGDALDLESCKNALIINSQFDAGDDGICIKSGKDADGRKRGMPCENVVVEGCTVFAGHGGFVVGSEMSGGVKNISVRNSQFLGTDVGLRFKSTRGRGGIVENIFIDGISMTDIQGDAITFDLYYGGKSKDGEAQPVDETTPAFRDIHISNIICNGAGRAFYFNGLPEMPIRNIRLKNMQIVAKKDGEFNFCEGIEKENVNVIVKTR